MRVSDPDAADAGTDIVGNDCSVGMAGRANAVGVGVSRITSRFAIFTPCTFYAKQIEHRFLLTLLPLF